MWEVKIHRGRGRFKTSLTNEFEFGLIWPKRQTNSKKFTFEKSKFRHRKEISIDIRGVHPLALPRKSETSKKLGPSRQRNPLRHGWQKAREGWKWSTRVARASSRYSNPIMNISEWPTHHHSPVLGNGRLPLGLLANPASLFAQIVRGSQSAVTGG